MSRVVEINNVDQLAGYDLLWNTLLTRTADASFFMSLDWLRAYGRQASRAQQLRVLIIHAGGEPIGILPLTIVQEKTKLGSVRVLTYPVCPGGHFFGPIGPNPAATLTLAMQHIQHTPRHWQVLDLRPIDAPGRDRGRTPHAMNNAGLSCHESIGSLAAVVDTDGTWGAYLASREPGFRQTLCQQLQALNRSRRVQYVRYRPRGSRYGDDDPQWDLYGACVSMCLAGDRETHVLAVKRGALDLNLLLYDGRPASFCYGFHFQEQVHLVSEGRARCQTKIDLNAVLRALHIQDSFQRGDRLIHFGSSSPQRERAWLSRAIPTYRYTYVPARVTSQLSRLKRWFG